MYYIYGEPIASLQNDTDTYIGAMYVDSSYIYLYKTYLRDHREDCDWCARMQCAAFDPRSVWAHVLLLCIFVDIIKRTHRFVQEVKKKKTKKNKTVFSSSRVYVSCIPWHLLCCNICARFAQGKQRNYLCSVYICNILSDWHNDSLTASRFDFTIDSIKSVVFGALFVQQPKKWTPKLRHQPSAYWPRIYTKSEV